MINEKIEKEGSQWVVKSKDGKTLGTHDTKEDAVNQLQAIEANKPKNEIIEKPELDASSYDPDVLQKAIDDAKEHTQDYESAFHMAIHNLATNPEYRKKIQRFLSKKISEKEKVKGGLADDADPSAFDADQVIKGIKVEFEHTDDFDTAVEIALDHLVEDPKYYDKLAKIEPQHDIDEMSAAGGGAVAGAANDKSNIDKDNPWYGSRVYSLEESINYFVDDFLKKKLNESRGYKNYEKNMSIADVGKLWAEERVKLYDPKGQEFHGLFPVKNVSPYKEFDRDVKNKHKLRKELLKNGWDKSKPAMIMVGKNGKVCLKEGNHRLKILEELKSMTGKRFMVPVRFFFYKNVECGISVLDKDHEYDERWKTATNKRISDKAKDKDLKRLKAIFGLEEERFLNEISDTAANYVLDKINIDKNETPNELFDGKEKQRKIVRLPANIHPQMENIIQFFENNGYNLDLANGIVVREYERIIPAGPKKGETEIKRDKKKIGKALNGVVSFANKIIDPLKEVSFKMVKGFMEKGQSNTEAQAMVMFGYDQINSKNINQYPKLEKCFNYIKQMGKAYPEIYNEAHKNSSFSFHIRNFFEVLGFEDVGFYSIFRKLQGYQNKINEWPSFWNEKSKDYINNPDAIYEENENILVISRHPMDVLRMSDTEVFDNCHAEMRKTGDSIGEEGVFFECAVQEAINGGAVVFAVNLKDFKERVQAALQKEDIENLDDALNDRELFFDPERPEISGPLEYEAESRLRLRKIKATGPDDEFTFMAPEPRIYGTGLTILYETLKDFAFKKQKGVFAGKDLGQYKYKVMGGSWEDTFLRKLLKGFFNNTSLDGEWIENAEYQFRSDRSEPFEQEYILKHSTSMSKYGEIIGRKLAQETKESRLIVHYDTKPDKKKIHDYSVRIRFMFRDTVEPLTFEEGKKYLTENNLLWPTLSKLENMYLKNLGFRFKADHDEIINQVSGRLGNLVLIYRDFEEDNNSTQSVDIEYLKDSLDMFQEAVEKLMEDLDEFFESAQYILEEAGSEVFIA